MIGWLIHFYKQRRRKLEAAVQIIRHKSLLGSGDFSKWTYYRPARELEASSRFPLFFFARLGFTSIRRVRIWSRCLSALSDLFPQHSDLFAAPMELGAAPSRGLSSVSRSSASNQLRSELDQCRCEAETIDVFPASIEVAARSFELAPEIPKVLALPTERRALLTER